MPVSSGLHFVASKARPACTHTQSELSFWDASNAAPWPHFQCNREPADRQQVPWSLLKEGIAHSQGTAPCWPVAWYMAMDAIWGHRALALPASSPSRVTIGRRAMQPSHTAPPRLPTPHPTPLHPFLPSWMTTVNRLTLCTTTAHCHFTPSCPHG
eukprot:614339-Pelagomonas_calceolata.AAC.1